MPYCLIWQKIICLWNVLPQHGTFWHWDHLHSKRSKVVKTKTIKRALWSWRCWCRWLFWWSSQELPKGLFSIYSLFLFHLIITHNGTTLYTFCIFQNWPLFKGPTDLISNDANSSDSKIQFLEFRSKLLSNINLSSVKYPNLFFFYI